MIKKLPQILVLLFGIFGMQFTSQACDRASLELNNMRALPSNQYEINLTFCAGAGLSATATGADQNTSEFAFFVSGGATILSYDSPLVSPQTNANYNGTLYFGDTALLYSPLIPEWWATIDSGPVQTICEDITIITQGLPNDIQVWGLEAGGNPPAGCLGADVTVYPPTNCGSLAASVPTTQTVNAGNPCAILTVQATGGNAPYTYLWSDGKTTPTTAACISTSTTYYITVTDALGCQVVNSVQVNYASACGLSVQSSPTQYINPGVSGYDCATVTAVASGGSGTYSYLWNGGETTQTITRCPSSGSYAAVVATDMYTGCTASTFTSILAVNCNSLSSVISPNTFVDPNHATLNSAVLSANGVGGSGNYSYLWNTGATTTTITVAPTVATSYDVTIVDLDNGCEVSNSVLVDIAPVFSCNDLLLAVSGDDQVFSDFGPSCATITAIGSGGSGNYTYDWVTGATTASISVCPNQSTDYTVVVTDLTTGCIKVKIFTVSYEDVSCGRRNNKVLICKNNVTYCVRSNKVQRKLNEGATLGACTSNNNARTNRTPEIILETIADVSVAPNPFVGELTISYKAVENELINVALYDITGRVIKNVYNGGVDGGMVHEFYIDGNQLNHGLYIVRIQNNSGEVLTKKIIKQPY